MVHCATFRGQFAQITGRMTAASTNAEWSPFSVSSSTLLLLLWVPSRDWSRRFFRLDPAMVAPGQYFVCAALLCVVLVSPLQCRAEVTGDMGMGRDHFHGRVTV